MLVTQWRHLFGIWTLHLQFIFFGKNTGLPKKNQSFWVQFFFPTNQQLHVNLCVSLKSPGWKHEISLGHLKAQERTWWMIWDIWKSESPGKYVYLYIYICTCIPRHSMSIWIFTCIYHADQSNVGKYTIHIHWAFRYIMNDMKKWEGWGINWPFYIFLLADFWMFTFNLERYNIFRQKT